MGRWIWVMLALAACPAKVERDATAANIDTTKETVANSPVCDANALGGIDEIVGMESTPAIVAAIAGEACRFPEPIEQALREVAVSYACVSAAPGIAAAPALFLKACPAGHETANVFISNDRPTANRLFAEQCNLPRLGFATLDELSGAPHYACTMLGSMVFVVLAEAGEPRATQVARMIVLGRR